MHSVVTAAGVLIAAVVSGATGLVFPLIAGPLLLLDHAPPQAVLITAVCSLIGQITSLILLRPAVAYEIRCRLIFACLAGIPIGTAMLLRADVSHIRFGFGCLLLVSGGWCLVRGRKSVTPALERSETLVGLCGGICGGLFGVSSVVPALWLALCGLDKHRQRACLQPYIIVAQGASLLMLTCSGACDATVLRELVVCLPPLLIGTFAGAMVFHALSQRWYARGVVGAVLVSGLALLFS
jgi:uncharacterized protein